MVSRQLEAPDVPACGPGLPPSAWVLSCTWSRPKYEKPGDDGSPAGATQCAAEAVPGKIANDMVSASPTKILLGSFMDTCLWIGAVRGEGRAMRTFRVAVQISSRSLQIHLRDSSIQSLAL